VPLMPNIHEAWNFVDVEMNFDNKEQVEIWEKSFENNADPAQQ